MAKIKIITDSAADIPKDLAEKYDITVLPFCIIINEEIFYDGVTINSRDYLKKLRSYSEIPKTSMVPFTMLENEFKKNLENYDHQIYISISSKSSGIYNSALLIKSQIEEELGHESNITVLDSGSFTMVYGKTVLKMAMMAQKGDDYQIIIDFYNYEMPRCNAYFIVDDLEHLQKGGRIKPGIAFIGGLLGIKPVLTINDGLVDFVGKERGKVKALETIVNKMISELNDPSQAEIIIANGYADEDCKLVREILEKKITPKSICECNLGCVIGTHAGSGLVGLIFSK